MILGYHVIFSAYGFWLPNDPRGSWSEFVGAWELFRAGGKATKTTERRSLAYDAHDRGKRLATKQSLQRQTVKFNEVQRDRIAEGFRQYAEKSRLCIWACAIMPDHVHLVVDRFRLSMEQMVVQLKGESTEALIEAGIHPFQNDRDERGRPHKCWCRGEWKVYLNSAEDVCRAVPYTEMNPIKDGLSRQYWPFVRAHPYDGVGLTRSAPKTPRRG
jgi:REP element-mobilizing transposase RayT